MEIADFELERYFARWEFAAAHLLCASDPEPVPMGELLAMADPQTERLWADLRLGYTESVGHPLLRAEIARSYQTVDPDQVLVCSGAQEAIFVSLGAMLGPGDHAVVVWPSYQAERVLLLPGSVFGHPGNHVRLGFGRRDLPDALAALTRFAANGSCPLAARPAASR